MMATEDDPTPWTRFIRYVAAGSVPLPNEKWIRSPKQRDYAICLDPGSAHPGWLMLEGWNDNWVSVRKLTQEDLIALRDLVHNPAHKALLTAQWERNRG